MMQAATNVADPQVSDPSPSAGPSTGPSAGPSADASAGSAARAFAGSPSTASGTGAADVARTVRQVARGSRDLFEDIGEAVERELTMAVALSERLRDEAVAPATLADARSLRVQAGIRDSAHRFVDLVADVVGVATMTIVRFGEGMADDARPSVTVRAAGGPDAGRG